jgi:hypothetical protein
VALIIETHLQMYPLKTYKQTFSGLVNNTCSTWPLAQHDDMVSIEEQHYIAKFSIHIGEISGAFSTFKN